MKTLVAVQKDPQEGVKTSKVVHMCVSHKSMGNLQYLSGGKSGKVSHVEEQGASFEEEWYE